MSALFPPWSTSAGRLIVLVMLASPVALVVFLLVLVRTPYVQDFQQPVDQPIQFDHRHHVRDAEIDCRYCHYLVERSPYAGVPPTELCMGCHNQIWNDAPPLRPLRASYFEDRPIPWRRVYDLPDFVYFHHAAHVRRGVGCSTCHGRVDLMASVYRPVPTTMAWCLQCHRDPEPWLRPPDRITDMEWGDGPSFATGLEVNGTATRAHISGDGAGGDDDVVPVRPPTNCTGCHR